MTAPLHELAPLWLGLAGLLLATALAWRGTIAAAAAGTARSVGPALRLQPLIAAALACIALALALRWSRLGHGPFFNMFEILSSNVLSLGFAYLVVHWRYAAIRPVAAIVLSVLALMSAWLLGVAPLDSHFAPTYATPVLWFHVLLGKTFLACVLVALGLATVVLLRGAARLAPAFSAMPDDGALDRLAWLTMQLALAFETMMLIAGAVWAQDAWGRWWAWDPLETWAFVTWLSLVAAIHLRGVTRVGPRAGALLIWAVFVLAFLTFFGVPFISAAPHKGAI